MARSRVQPKKKNRSRLMAGGATLPAATKFTGDVEDVRRIADEAEATRRNADRIQAEKNRREADYYRRNPRATRSDWREQQKRDRAKAHRQRMMRNH